MPPADPTQTPASPPPATPPAVTPPAPAGNAPPNLGAAPAAPTSAPVAAAQTPNLGAPPAPAPAAPPNLGANPAQPPAPAAPPDIEFKVPQGLEKDPFLADFKGLAKDLGLDSAKAQKAVDSYAKVATTARERLTSEWGQAWRADPEIGGAKFDESFQVALRGLEKFGSPGLKQVLEQSGLGSHPEVVRAFYRVGKAISEDSSAGRRGADVQGATPTIQSDEALARQMYPELYNKKE